MALYHWDNCTEDIHRQVIDYVDVIRHFLDDQLIGVYLHGSLAMGCFNPNRSDIDMLIVTTNPLTLSEQHHMTEVTLAGSLKPSPFELSSLALEYLNQWEHPCRYDFHYSEDWREKLSAELANGAFQNWSQPVGKDGDLAGHVMIVRQRGLTLYGEPLHDVFPMIPMEHYQASILSDYRWLLQNDLGKTVYGILNMCRIWQHFSDGAISSKDEGGVWALLNLPDQHHEVVKKALGAYRDNAVLDIDETRYKAFSEFVALQIEDRFV